MLCLSVHECRESLIYEGHTSVVLCNRRLQSCVGTRARFAQLRKAYFVTTLYAICTSVVRKHAYAIYGVRGQGSRVFLRPVLVI